MVYKCVPSAIMKEYGIVSVVAERSGLLTRRVTSITGSNPVGPISKLNNAKLPKWTTGFDCKSNAFGLRRFESFILQVEVWGWLEIAAPFFFFVAIYF